MTGALLEVDLPERFVLETLTSSGEWIEFGRFPAEAFARTPDGAYMCSGWGASPTFLRVLRQDGAVIHVVDGSGVPFVYRLLPDPGIVTVSVGERAAPNHPSA